jgi:homoserine kinase
LRGDRLRVLVPASSANLGPGFDALGLALGLYDEIEVVPGEAGLTVLITGEGAGTVISDESNLVVRAVWAGCRHLGLPRPPGLHLNCRNGIPHARGLGSSAAAVVGGLAVAYGLAGRQPDAGALRLAAEFEGHADNAAASLLGGLVLAWHGPDGFAALRLEPHPDLRPVVLIPEERSATSMTRSLLPESVPHAAAAFNAGRCALAVQAVTTRPDLLLAATEDRLHQDYRQDAWPRTMALVRALRREGVAATVSGAGPTVVAFTVDGSLPEVDHTGFTARELPVDRQGVRIEFD